MNPTIYGKYVTVCQGPHGDPDHPHEPAEYATDRLIALCSVCGAIRTSEHDEKVWEQFAKEHEHPNR